tara:strand:- start:528 stop:695 length:168 start_codon:yes stop_codon:yes gene_type:complete
LEEEKRKEKRDGGKKGWRKKVEKKGGEKGLRKREFKRRIVQLSVVSKYILFSFLF